MYRFLACAIIFVMAGCSLGSSKAHKPKPYDPNWRLKEGEKAPAKKPVVIRFKEEKKQEWPAAVEARDMDVRFIVEWPKPVKRKKAPKKDWEKALEKKKADEKKAKETLKKAIKKAMFDGPADPSKEVI